MNSFVAYFLFNNMYNSTRYCKKYLLRNYKNIVRMIFIRNINVFLRPRGQYSLFLSTKSKNG